ncbi:hypothetical protein BHE74_00010673 [Ensete ventricosum]|nr:hypothetical protein BHE74_00010673 [Ensete ventricosum]
MNVSFLCRRESSMLHCVEFRSRLGMFTNTPSFVYKPMHEYRILRVSNSPHLCEFCTTFSDVAQHLPLCTVSSFTEHSACLEHWLLGDVVWRAGSGVGTPQRSSQGFVVLSTLSYASHRPIALVNSGCQALAIMKLCHDFDSAMAEESLVAIQKRYSILNEYVLHAPLPGQRPYDSYPNRSEGLFPTTKVGRPDIRLSTVGGGVGLSPRMVAHPVSNVPPYLSNEELVLVGRLKGILSSSQQLRI